MRLGDGHFFGEVAERKMFFVQLHERRKLAATDFFRTLATQREWTARRKMRDIRQKSYELANAYKAELLANG